MEYNDELKRRLKLAGITRQDVANATGSSMDAVHSWLSRGKPIPPHKLKIIESMLVSEPVPFNAVRTFAVRVTNAEWEMLKQTAGVEHLTAEAAEIAVRNLLQETWNRLAGRDNSSSSGSQPLPMSPPPPQPSPPPAPSTGIFDDAGN